jgi:hypothetical protein
VYTAVTHTLAAHSMASPPPTPSRSLSQSGPSSSYATPSLTSSRNNPISLRIYKAIGTSFDDPGSREALELVSSFYAPTTSVKGKEKERNETGHVENGYELEEDEAPRRRTLKGQSASMARKYLKKDVERKLADGSGKFLKAFGEVDQVSRLASDHMWPIDQ